MAAEPEERMPESPAECRTMAELRRVIDVLDRRLVDLLAERAACIDRAAEIKLGVGLPAAIPDRVEDVVARVRARAGEIGLDPDLVETLWRGLIDWSIAREELVLGKEGE